MLDGLDSKFSRFDYEKFKMRRMRTGNLARELPEKLVKIDNPKDVSGSVERFDIEPLSDFSSKLSNFIRLVLCCIDAKIFSDV